MARFLEVLADIGAQEEMSETEVYRKVLKAASHALRRRFGVTQKFDPTDAACSAVRSIARRMDNGVETDGDLIQITGIKGLTGLVIVMAGYKIRNWQRRYAREFDLVNKAEPVDELTNGMEELADDLSAALHNEFEQKLFRLKLEGLTKAEIAERLGLSRRTVERRWNLIQEKISRRLRELG